jgi:hypothetical protein
LDLFKNFIEGILEIENKVGYEVKVNKIVGNIE